MLRPKVDGVANQWQTNPRQEKFLEYYFDNRSSTFANAFQSALLAGYTETYARTLTAPAVKNMWLRQNNRISLTEEHINLLVEDIAITGNRQSDKLRALELLAKLRGMIVDKSANISLNIEAALSDLK